MHYFENFVFCTIFYIIEEKYISFKFHTGIRVLCFFVCAILNTQVKRFDVLCSPSLPKENPFNTHLFGWLRDCVSVDFIYLPVSQYFAPWNIIYAMFRTGAEVGWLASVPKIVLFFDICKYFFTHCKYTLTIKLLFYCYFLCKYTNIKIVIFILHPQENCIYGD